MAKSDENVRARGEEFSRLEEEFKSLFEQLKATPDPCERKLLLQDIDMLLRLTDRLIKQHDERLRAALEERLKPEK